MQAGFRDVWGGVERVARENPELVDFVRDEVAARGPISARELEVEEVRDRSNWGWNWSSVKTVLEWLFYCGEVTSVRRNSQFERVYDLPERVLPAGRAGRADAQPGGVGGRSGAPGGAGARAWPASSASGTTSAPGRR